MLTVLNDVHIGVLRSAGTTPESQWLLRQDVLICFKALLPNCGDVLILGDLFDTGNVPIYDVLETYEILSAWLIAHPQSRLYSVAGNHDLNRTSTVLSSFQFLGKLLAGRFPNQYVHIEQPSMTPHGYVVPHLRNQDLFDAAIAAVPECKYLFLHCNYDNNFAAQSDQSLNLSKEQAEVCKAEKIVIAHEHHRRDFNRILIPGNQIGTSVSDWLPNVDKFLLEITEHGHSWICAATRTDNLIELNYRELTQTLHKFVKVTGSVAAEELSGVLTTINKFRSKSPAFVVANGVTLLSEDGSTEVFSQALESVKKFSVLEALRVHLTEEEFKVVESLAC